MLEIYVRYISLAQLRIDYSTLLPQLERLRIEGMAGKNLGVSLLSCLVQYISEPHEMELVVGFGDSFSKYQTAPIPCTFFSSALTSTLAKLHKLYTDLYIMVLSSFLHLMSLKCTRARRIPLQWKNSCISVACFCSIWNLWILKGALMTIQISFRGLFSHSCEAFHAIDFRSRSH